MENSYGVGIDNRNALFLDDESDPLDTLKAREQAKELKKKIKEAEKGNKGKPETKPKGTSVVARKGIKEIQNVKAQGNKSGDQQKSKGPPRTGECNTERPPPRRRDDRPQNGAVESKDGAPRPPRREFSARRPNFERRNNFSDNPEGGERRGPRPQREPRESREEQRGPRPGKMVIIFGKLHLPLKTYTFSCGLVLAEYKEEKSKLHLQLYTYTSSCRLVLAENKEEKEKLHLQL
ncbi:unnamed protein product [Parnassius apollo]|uniref:(apollo) hypothetical protein n=1 Tax=Parnassius apollo TaxID=110799 RepID=A0A8S3Y1V2_PARAO|nr:unnamed protein product [Parnassius apollo]